MRVLLYDPYAGGHHEFYLERVARALQGSAEVVVVVSESTQADASNLDVIGSIPRDLAASPAASVKVLRRAVRDAKPDAVLHLFADRDIVRLAVGPVLRVPTSLLIFRPRSHYSECFGSSLTPRETAVGLAKDAFQHAWMAQSKQHRLLTLDQFAASRWQKRWGDRAAWWSEPPPVMHAAGSATRTTNRGVLLFGAIAPRKGVEALCAALKLTTQVKSVTFAGKVAEGYAAAFEAQIRGIEHLEFSVKVVNRWVLDDEAAGFLTGAGVVAIPYPRHFGMSRVLLEAAAAGTPVVGPRFGLIGKLIEEYDLGAQTEVNDPQAFAEALDSVIAGRENHDSTHRMQFVGRYSDEAFISTVRGILPAENP